MRRDSVDGLLYGVIACLIVAMLMLPRPRALSDSGWNERNVAVVAAAARTQRLRAVAATKATERQEVRVVTAGAKVDTAVVRVNEALDSARAALADSAATVPSLRRTLFLTAERCDSLVKQVGGYRVAVDAYRDTVTTERLEHRAALALSDSVGLGWSKVAARYKRERNQARAAVGGVTIGGIALILLIK